MPNHPNQQFRLKWNNHQNTVLSEFETLLHKNSFVDCTLGAEGILMKAHKLVLSACSPYFAEVFYQHADKHPVIILKDVTQTELKCMMEYMYCGEINISESQLASFLQTAQSLKIKGLAEDLNTDDIIENDNEVTNKNSAASTTAAGKNSAKSNLIGMSSNVETSNGEPVAKKSALTPISENAVSNRKRKIGRPAHSYNNRTARPATKILQNTAVTNSRVTKIDETFDDGNADVENHCSLNAANEVNHSGNSSDADSVLADTGETSSFVMKQEVCENNSEDYALETNQMDDVDSLIEETTEICERPVGIEDLEEHVESETNDEQSPANNSNNGEDGNSSSRNTGFPCQRCSKTFKDSLSLWSHASFECRVRPPVDVYTCEFCVYQSKWKSNLKRHKLMVHKHLIDQATSSSNNILTSTSST